MFPSSFRNNPDTVIFARIKILVFISGFSQTYEDHLHDRKKTSIYACPSLTPTPVSFILAYEINTRNIVPTHTSIA